MSNEQLEQKAANSYTEHVWLSYADDDGFRGVVIVKGGDFLNGVKLSRELGVSPGGQVAGGVFYAEDVPGFDDSYCNRLLTKKDIDDAGWVME